MVNWRSPHAEHGPYMPAWRYHGTDCWLFWTSFTFQFLLAKKCHEVSQNTRRRNGSRVWHRFRPPLASGTQTYFDLCFGIWQEGIILISLFQAKTGRKAGEFIGVPAEFVADEFAQILTGFQPLMFRQRRLVMRGISKHLKKKNGNATGNFLIRNNSENNTCEICLVLIGWFTFLMLFIDMSDSKGSDTTNISFCVYGFPQRSDLSAPFFCPILPDLPFPILSWTHQFPLFVLKELTQPYSKWLTITSTFFSTSCLSMSNNKSRLSLHFFLYFLPHIDTHGAGKIESVRQHVCKRAMWWLCSTKFVYYYYFFYRFPETNRWAQSGKWSFLSFFLLKNFFFLQGLHQHSPPPGLHSENHWSHFRFILWLWVSTTKCLNVTDASICPMSESQSLSVCFSKSHLVKCQECPDWSALTSPSRLAAIVPVNG